MLHAFAYILFILPFTAWLGHELKRPVDLKKYWGWLLAVFIVGVLGNFSSVISSGKLSNFLLHASGGAACTLLYVYLTKTLKLHFNWRLTVLFLFAFVCMLGIVNELAEYAGELLDVGKFSFDTHDTWRDMVANTTGAAVVWLLLTSYNGLKKHS